MRKSIWEKRIPTLLGLVLIVAAIGLTSFLVGKQIIFIGKAGPGHLPKNLKVANVTDSSFTVSYQTDDSVIGSINYGSNQKLGQLARDEKDQETEKLSARRIHSITIRGLSPSTKYFFSITSDQDTFLNNGLPFDASTAAKIDSSPTNQKPITGTIVTDKGSPPTEAIIYVTVDGAQVISGLTKEDGTYLIPLNSLRTSDLNKYFEFSQDSLVRIMVFSVNSSSNALTTLSQIAPVPTITLSKNYDFSTEFEPVATPSGVIEKFPSFPYQSITTKGSEVTIKTPTANQGFSDQQPVFKGTALPNTSVKITIHSQDIESTVTSDANGNWSFRPSEPLAPGNHTIAIVTKDSSGIAKTITESFVVYASGAQVVESATPSATPTIQITPTPTPIVIPTGTPTESITLTPTPSVIPSTVPLTPTPTIGSPGSPSALNFGILGVAITLFGGFLFFLSRRSVSL